MPWPLERNEIRRLVAGLISHGYGSGLTSSLSSRSVANPCAASDAAARAAGSGKTWTGCGG